MSATAATCVACGASLHLEILDERGTVASRVAKAYLRVAHCDECSERAERADAER